MFASSRIPMRAKGLSPGEPALQVLGLSRGATEAEIKARYRQLVAAEHPDKKPGDPKAVARFVEIVKAYQLLTEDGQQSESAPAGDGADAEFQEPLPRDVQDTLDATKGISETLRAAVSLVFVLALLTQPLGFWAADEIQGKCTSGKIDRPWCEQLVRLRCVGEFAFGDPVICAADGQKLIAVASDDDALPDGRRIVMRLDRASGES